MCHRRLLDELLPQYDVRERHHLTVAAPPNHVWHAIQAVTLREMPLVWLLSAARSLPVRLADGRSLPLAGGRPLFAQLLGAGFTLLAEEPGREVVAGVVGQMWKLRGGAAPRVGDGAQFAAFDRPGFVKAAMSFRVTARKAGTLVETETRVLATDQVSRRQFARYWRLIRLGSGAIRRSWLRAAARQAAGAVR